MDTRSKAKSNVPRLEAVGLRPVKERRFHAPSVIVGLLLLTPLSTMADDADIEDAAIQRGKILVGEKCTECHSLRRVFRAHGSVAHWHEIVGRMMDQGLDISPEERSDIVLFLASQKDDPSVAELIGQFHFLVLHFPIAIIMVVAVAEVWRWLRGAPVARDTLHALVRWGMVLTLLTVVLGLTLISAWETKSVTLEYHRDMGIATAVCVVMAWLFRERSVKSPSTVSIGGYRLTLLAAAMLVGLTGHLGGDLVHGDPLNGLIQHFLQNS